MTREWAQNFLPQVDRDERSPLPEPPSPPPASKPAIADSTRRTLAILCHASCFIAVIFPLAIIVIPVVLILTSQDHVVKRNAAEVLNFVVSLILYGVVGSLWVVLTPESLRFLLLPLLIFLLIGASLASLLLPLIAIIHCAQTPDQPYRYPLILHPF
ncbi:MAG: DUF4870 domain-containing protein [Spirulinaceae cyanobacterium RM2_2_10]|nr:DUF4870 domain-containing protein [Spirulinaceae cyanobacterium RM2_2_10]